MEKELFQKYQVEEESLLRFGFQHKENYYEIHIPLLSNFLAHIIVDQNGFVKGKVIDLDTKEEYTAFRQPNNLGSFASSIKEEYIKILENIREHCFIETPFISAQANRISKYILDTYQDRPEFLWEKYPNFGVFRHKKNQKWYAIIMNVPYSILNGKKGNVDIINLKVNDKVEQLIKNDGCYPAYHMNKKYWITLVLDDTLSDEEILYWIDTSYENTL